MDKIAQLFEQEGEALGFVEHNQLDLSGQQKVWYVSQGKVDLFLIREHQDGRTGALKYFSTVHPGEIFLEHGPIDDYANWRLIAKPSLATKLTSMSFEAFQKHLSKEDSRAQLSLLIERSIKNQIKSFIQGTTPVQHQLVAIDESYNFEKAVCISSSVPSICWIKVIQGDVRYLDDEWSSDYYLPLMSKAWLECSEQTQVETYASDTVLIEKKLFSTWYHFQQCMLRRAVVKILKKLDLEHALFGQRLEEGSQLYKEAVAEISQFFKKCKYDYKTNIDYSDTALASCQLVGNALHMSITTPKELPRDKDDKTKLNYVLQHAGIMKRQVALAGKWWQNNHGPMVAFKAEDQTAVALIADSESSYHLFDPNTKVMTPVTEEVAKGLDGFAFTLYRSLPEDKLSLTAMLKWGLAGFKPDLLLIMMMAIAGGLLSITVPWVTGKLYSVVIPEASYSLLVQLILALLASTFGLTVFQLTRSYTLTRVRGWLNDAYISGIWDRLTKLPISFYKNYSAGDLMQRAGGFNGIMQQLFGVSADSILDLVYAVFYFSVLFYYSTQLAFLALALLILIFTVSLLILRRNIAHERSAAQLQGKLSGLLAELVIGMQKIKITSSESRFFNRWSRDFIDYRRRTVAARHMGNLLASLNSIFPTLSTVAVFALVAQLINQGELNLGQFLAFNAAFGSLIGIIMKSSGTLGGMLSLIPGYERSKPIIETDIESSLSQKDPGTLLGKIEVSHVDFRYTETGPLILKDVSLTIEPGQFVAIVGPSGSGKSTLFRLLLQFEHAEQGGIFFDNKDVDDLDINLIRRQIGVVLQNSALLPGSIFENIVGSSTLTLEDAWHAARMSGLEADINEMPMGMHTMIAEGSGGLSGGQRQRLLIARAMVHKPGILFFDEATSALDNETQAIVSKSFNKLQSTRVVIAHRLSTVIDADKIVVLKDGVIMESGNYDELMALGGVFSKMAKRQIV